MLDRPQTATKSPPPGPSSDASDPTVLQHKAAFPNARPLTVSKATAALRAAGLAGGGDLAALGIQHLQQVRTRLQLLREELPNLSNTINLLIDASGLQVSPNRSLPVDGLSGVSHSGPLFWWQSPTDGLKPTASALSLDVAAIRWVYIATVRLWGDQLPDHLAGGMQTPDRLFSKGLLRIATPRLPQPIVDGPLQMGGYLPWASLIRKHLPADPLPDLIERLRTVTEFPHARATLRQGHPLPRLNERQLSKQHWYFPRPEELEKLHTFLNRELDPRTPSQKRLEAGLIALSIVCCRTILGVLGWPVCARGQDRGGRDRFQLADIQTGSGSTKVGAFWLKSEHCIRGAVAKLQLPPPIQTWLVNLHPGLGTHALGHLLPASATPWEQRAYACLAEELGCTPRRAELMIRDLVPRFLYAQTSNSALVDFWRADSSSQIDRADRVALSHYLQPHGKRVRTEYAKACESATGISVGRAVSAVSVTLGSKPLELWEVQKVFESLRRLADEASTEVERHNASAYLTLFILLLATGHRQSNTPFPFPWDFSLCEWVVFICDKLVTGSEARFAPLVPTALAYLERYALSVRKLTKSPDVSAETRTYAQKIYHLLGFNRDAPPSGKWVDFYPHAGVFFLLEPDGSISKSPLTTHKLDRLIKDRTGLERTVRRLRTTMAQYLWEKGCSGRAVQAFLGHQPELHVHGPESTWSVLDVNDTLSPVIELYFREQLDLPSPTPIKPTPPRHYPSLVAKAVTPGVGLPLLGYEGREREHGLAELRAKEIIRRELSEHLFSMPSDPNGPPLVLTEAEKERIRERVRTELANDPVALGKISPVLEKHLDALQRRWKLELTAKSYSHRLASAGPIEVSFSRSLRFASVLRQLWEENVGQPLGSPQTDPIERLAQLAISLACFDGVIAPENLRALVLAAATQDFDAYGHEMTLRCQVVTATHDYEFCVRPGATSAALIMGCASIPKDFTAEWSQVEQRIQLMLRKVMPLGDKAKWSTSRLCLVLRPYWLIRLPGAMYSVAIGAHKGPAADARSEAQLHGVLLNSEVRETTAPAIRTSDVKTDKQRAYAAIKRMMAVARGTLERGDRHRRAHRAALREGLESLDAAQALEYGREAPIVGYLISFIGKLLDSGGPRKALLAPSSIEAYFYAVAWELIDQAWSFDFESASEAELLELFESVSAKASGGSSDLVLRLFCNHLRDEVAIPYFSPRWFDVREPIRVRSALVLIHQHN